MSKLERELAKLEGKLNRGEISDDIFHATKERLETEAASKSAVASTGTIVQQEKEAWDIVRNTQRSRSSGSPSSEAPIVKPVQDDPLAELIAMRAKGEISGEEFARARKLLEPKKAEEPPPVTASVKKISDRDAALQALAARYKAADGHLPQSDNPAPSPNKPKPSQAKTWVGLILLAALGIGFLSSNKPATSDQTASTPKCFSPWDGSNSDFVTQLKRSLRDPDSFEHMQTKTSQDTSGRLLATMEYRAKNGFGGYNVAQAIAVIDASSCNVLEILP